MNSKIKKVSQKSDKNVLIKANKNVFCVLSGFVSLLEDEKEKFFDEIERYKEEMNEVGYWDASERLKVRITHNKMTLGPIGVKCACCGK